MDERDAQPGLQLSVTGHQRLGSAEQVEWVRSAVEQAVAGLHVAQGHTCLAAGADQIFAEVLVARRVPFAVIVPSAHYERSFQDGVGLDGYGRLLGLAASVTVLDFAEPGEAAYAAAGARLVERADALLAIWNGSPAQLPGATGAVVEQARSRQLPILHIDPWQRTVRWLGGQSGK